MLFFLQLLFQRFNLTGIAVVAASLCVARAITGTARGTVAAAILVIAEAAFLAARLAGTLAAETLTTANAQGIPGVAVGLAVPLTMAFLASGMAMTAVRRAVVKTVSGITGRTAAGFVAGVTAAAIAAEAGVVAAAETSAARSAATRAAVAARTI